MNKTDVEVFDVSGIDKFYLNTQRVKSLTSYIKIHSNFDLDHFDENTETNWIFLIGSKWLIGFTYEI